MDHRFNPLSNNLKRTLPTLLLQCFVHLPVLKAALSGAILGSLEGFASCSLCNVQTDHVINADFVLNVIWRPWVPLWALQLPAGKEPASEVKRGVQGVKIKNSED